MSVNATDNKFGLPKPDFQELPKKKVVWPFFVIFAIVVVLLIAAKMGYKFYFQTFGRNHPLASAQLQNSASTSHQAKDGRSAKERLDVNGAVNPGAAPKHKKNPKVKESISATQKQLAAKQNKSLVKPGTYQELKTPQGIYHLVVISHLDKRFAMQEVQRLIKKNLGVCLILPRLNKGEKYYRVTIGHSKTEYEADKKLKHFKPAYKNIFVLKY